MSTCPLPPGFPHAQRYRTDQRRPTPPRPTTKRPSPARGHQTFGYVRSQRGPVPLRAVPTFALPIVDPRRLLAATCATREAVGTSALETSHSAGETNPANWTKWLDEHEIAASFALHLILVDREKRGLPPCARLSESGYTIGEADRLLRANRMVLPGSILARAAARKAGAI